MLRKKESLIVVSMEWSAHHLMLPLIFTMALLIITTTVWSVIAHGIAMKMEYGAKFLAAVGVWDPPSGDERGLLMRPMMFMAGIIVFAACTRFLTSKSWFEIAPEGHENCSWLVTYSITVAMLMLLAVCMMTRYQAWH